MNENTVIDRGKCPNCQSPNYFETVIEENCPDCGLHCNYRGGGPNAVYERMIQRQHEAERKADRDAQDVL